MIRNFVSVSGITDRQQLKEIGEIYQREGLDYLVAIGYQVSSKSINQGTQNPRQPKFVELEDLCQETLRMGFIPAIHYYTNDDSNVLGDLERVVKTGIDPNSSLIQFNTLPQSIEKLKEVKKMGFGVILKVAVSDKKLSGGYKVWKGEGVQDASTGDVLPLLNQVVERSEVIDYAMFDPSHGTNFELNLSEDSLAISFGKAIIRESVLDHIGIIYAGGIGSANVGLVSKSLNTFFPNRTSIDTESRVRIDNRLDLNLVRAYLTSYVPNNI